MDNIYIVGIGKIRFNKYPTETVRSMAEQSINLALDDAGLNKTDLQAVYFANSFWGMFDKQDSIRGQVVMRGMGVDKIPVTNVENACAGASTALHLAYTGIRAQMFDVALVVGSEKITNPDKALSFEAYARAMDVENFKQHIEMITKLGSSFKLPDTVEESAPGQGRSIFMDAYAMMCRWHMNRFGTTRRQLAEVCSKNHFHASLNPLAQYQNTMRVEAICPNAK